MSEEKRDFKVIGKSVPRVNGADKVRGKALFTDDMALPGMVYGKIKHATVAHARARALRRNRCWPLVWLARWAWLMSMPRARLAGLRAVASA